MLRASILVLVWPARVSELLSVHALNLRHSQDGAFSLEECPLEMAIQHQRYNTRSSQRKIKFIETQGFLTPNYIYPKCFQMNG